MARARTTVRRGGSRTRGGRRRGGTLGVEFLERRTLLDAGAGPALGAVAAVPAAELAGLHVESITTADGSPLDGQFLVSLPDGQINVTFNHPLQGLADNTPASFAANPYAVFLVPRGADGVFSAPSGFDSGDLPLHNTLNYHVNADGTSTITLTLTVPLGTDVYALGVSGGLADTAGDPLTDAGGNGGTVWASFEVAPDRPITPDLSPLNVVSVTTHGGTVAVHDNQIPQPDTLAVAFNRPMNILSVNANTVRLLDSSANNAVVPSVVAYSPTTGAAYLTPQGALVPGHVYVVSVAASVNDDQGFPNPGVPLSAAYFTSFTVSGAPAGAGQAPFQVATANGAPDVSPAPGSLASTPEGYASVRFTEAVNLSAAGAAGRFSVMQVPRAGGLNNGVFDSADVPVNATLAFNPNTNQLVVVPTTPLADDVYLITLNQLKAADGDALSQPGGAPLYYSFLLQAGTLQATVAPTLSHDTAPGGGVNSDGITSDPTITGPVYSATPVTQLSAALDGDPHFVDVTSALQAGAAFPQFTLSAAKLAQINGGPLGDGPHVLRLRASAQGGATPRLFEIGFVLDTQPPTLVVTQGPAPGLVTNQNVTISGTAADAGSGLASVQVQIDSANPLTVPIDAAGDFSFETNLPAGGAADGAHTVTVLATDVAGNSTAGAPATFTYRTAAPQAQASVSGPVATPPATITVTFTAAMNAAAFDPAHYALAGLDGQSAGITSVVASSPTTARITVNGTSALGAYVLTIDPTGIADTLGNALSGPLTFPFTVDTTAPTAALAIPATVPEVIDFIDIVYSEEVDAAGYDAAQYQLTRSDGHVVPVLAVFPLDEGAVRLQTGEPLTAGDYTVTVGGGVADLAGNPVAGARSFNFTVAPQPDATPAHAVLAVPPTVTTAPGSLDVAYDSIMTPSAFTAANYTLTALSGPSAGPVPIVSVGEPNFRSAHLVLGAPLADGQYRLDVAAAVTNVNGDALAAPTSFTFQVDTVDRTPPQAEVDVPGTLNLALDAFDVRFSEPMAASAFQAAGYGLAVVGGPNNGQAVPIQVRQQDATTAVVTLAAPLAPGSYHFAIGGQVTDLAGNPVAAPSSADFTVQAAPAPSAHVVLALGSLAGAGPFALEFQLTDGSAGTGGPTSQVAISNVRLQGVTLGAALDPTLGHVTGGLGASTLVLTDGPASAGPVSDLAQSFTVTGASATVSFDVSVRGSGGDPAAPDGFLVDVLDGHLTPVPTDAPDGRSLVRAVLNGTPATLQAASGTLAAYGVSATVTPLNGPAAPAATAGQGPGANASPAAPAAPAPVAVASAPSRAPDSSGAPGGLRTMALAGPNPQPDVFVSVNTDDANFNNIPDFADGYNLVGGASASANPNDYFTQVEVGLIVAPFETLDVDKTMLTFNYDASDPLGVQVSGGPYPDQLFKPASGSLRLWTKSATTLRNGHAVDSGGDYVAAAEYPLKDFNYTIDTSSGQKVYVIQLYLEGIRQSTSLYDKTIEVDAKLYETNGDFLGIELVLQASVTTDQVSLFTDSLNQHELDPPDTGDDKAHQLQARSPQDATSPGKRVVAEVSDDNLDGIVSFVGPLNYDGHDSLEYRLDRDHNGVPDYAQFSPITDADGSAAKFTPVILQIPSYVDPTQAKVMFEYQDSDPGAVQSEGVGNDQTYTVPDGKLRIWKKDAGEDRNTDSVAKGGDFVPNEVWVTLSQLGVTGSSTTVTLYVEALTPSFLPDDRPILVTLDPSGTGNPGNFARDAARFTATPAEQPAVPAESGHIDQAGGAYPWHFDYSVSANDGLVLTNVTLGTRLLAGSMSLPYFDLNTSQLGGSQRFELAPENGADFGHVRLVDFWIVENDDKAVAIQVIYAVNKIPDTQISSLLVTQRYDFHSPVAGDKLEPTGQVFGARFYPTVSYHFFNESGDSLGQVDFPQRFHFNTDGVNSFAAAFFADTHFGQVPALGPVAAPYGDPVATEQAVQVFQDGKSPAQGQVFGTNYVDNYHQSYNVFISPPVGGQLLPPLPGSPFGSFGSSLVPGPGCPECVHIHWRWGLETAIFGFPSANGGNPIIPDGSNQNLRVGVVVDQPGESDPNDWTALANGQPLVNGLSGSNLDFWYDGQGQRDYDQFMIHGGFFAPNPKGYVTPLTALNYGPFVYDRGTGLYKQTVTVTNTSTSTIPGPLLFILPQLVPGPLNLYVSALVNRTGTKFFPVGLDTYAYDYVTLPTSGAFAPGQSVSFTLQLRGLSARIGQSVSLSPKVFAGDNEPTSPDGTGS